MIGFDLTMTPWSRAGSYMALSAIARPTDHPGGEHELRHGIYLHDLSGRRLWRQSAVFRLAGLAGSDLRAPTVELSRPERLILLVEDGLVEVSWEDRDTLRFRGRRAGLRLDEVAVDPFDSAVAFPSGPGSWRLQMGEDAHYALRCLKGSLTVNAPGVRTGEAASREAKTIVVEPGDDGTFELALTQYESSFRAPLDRPSFDECVAAVADEHGAWQARYPRLAEPLGVTGMLAAYVTWSSAAGPRGLLGRPTVLMSKSWMNAVWSWDHCFNAIGLARIDPGCAWDQFMLPFDHQGPDGALPDLVHDAGRMWGFVKPPVHGWALRQLRSAGIVSDARLAEAYRPLARWTDWWLSFRDLDGDGLCEYFHGCDSGQDNASVFDAGFPTIAPDLAAFLIVQMDVLTDAAARLGLADEARGWAAQADAMLARLLDRLWDGERFRFINAATGAQCAGSRSQMPYLPLVLGSRLPASVRAAMVGGLRGSGLLTHVGIATESPESSLYEADGYWRGPVWAPTTLLLDDGLRVCGEQALATEMARRFLQTCSRSGFAENFDSMTGRPHRDPAYSWTAGVFWALAMSPEIADHLPLPAKSPVTM